MPQDLQVKTDDRERQEPEDFLDRGVPQVPLDNQDGQVKEDLLESLDQLDR